MALPRDGKVARAGDSCPPSASSSSSSSSSSCPSPPRTLTDSAVALLSGSGSPSKFRAACSRRSPKIRARQIKRDSDRERERERERGPQPTQTLMGSRKFERLRRHRPGRGVENFRDDPVLELAFFFACVSFFDKKKEAIDTSGDRQAQRKSSAILSLHNAINIRERTNTMCYYRNMIWIPYPITSAICYEVVDRFRCHPPMLLLSTMARIDPGGTCVARRFRLGRQIICGFLIWDWLRPLQQQQQQQQQQKMAAVVVAVVAAAASGRTHCVARDTDIRKYSHATRILQGTDTEGHLFLGLERSR